MLDKNALSLVTLEFKTTDNWQENLQTFTKLLSQTKDNSVVLAPEVCLTGFAYESMDKAVTFSQNALETLLSLSKNKIITFTMIEKKEQGYVNTLKVLYHGKVVHEQQKHKLFTFGGEDKHFLAGDEEKITIFEIEGIKFAALICFELRFKSLWQAIEGADIILIPSMWGKRRAPHFATLTQALALMNQCYVLASDSANEDMAKESGIITPFGIRHTHHDKTLLEIEIDFEEIKKMRRYLNVGI